MKTPPPFRAIAILVALALLALTLAACEARPPSDTQLSQQAQQEASGRAFTAIHVS